MTDETLIERDGICSVTGRQHVEFDPGNCADCELNFRCESGCGHADHPFISCETSQQIRERVARGTPIG